MLTPEEIARLVGAEIAAAQVPARPAEAQIRTSRLKIENPDKFDGKNTTSFNQWWEAVTMFLRFYPETSDRQKIAWLGTLLTDTVKAWHLNRYRDLGDVDTWVNYAAAIRAEYRNEREVADAQLKLGQLRYQGSIRSYLTEFQALNNFTPATGEGLREKVDLAIPDSILDMRFNQNEVDPIDDEGFLQATYRAGVQVEKKKALRAAKEAMHAGPAPTKEGKKEDRRHEGQQKEEKRPAKPREPRPRREEWKTTAAALKGVPQGEIDQHKKIPDGCWRCGRTGHRTYDCFSFQTMKGTSLPPAPWKAAVVGAPEPIRTSREKRKNEEEPESLPAAKQQEVVAVETMDIYQNPWEDSDSDF